MVAPFGAEIDKLAVDTTALPPTVSAGSYPAMTIPPK